MLIGSFSKVLIGSSCVHYSQPLVSRLAVLITRCHQGASRVAKKRRSKAESSISLPFQLLPVVPQGLRTLGASLFWIVLLASFAGGVQTV
jgi:hypothetical protein